MNSPNLEWFFEKQYDCELVQELPNGNYPHYFFPNGTTLGGKDGVLVKISPQEGDIWLGTFAGDIVNSSYPSKIFSWLTPNNLFVLIDGVGYLVDSNYPKNYKVLSIDPILDSFSIVERDLVVLSSFTYLIAYDKNGLAWETERISFDSLEVTSINSFQIEGKYLNSSNGEFSTFKVDLSNGKVNGACGL